MWLEKLNGRILPLQPGRGIVTCAWRCVGSGGERMLLEEDWVGSGGEVSGVACGLGCGRRRSGG